MEGVELTLWNKVKQVPPEYLKQIQAGRLKGKSDINPMWRYMAMTEQFGLCGVGWRYEVKRLWTEPAPNEQMFCFAELLLYFKDGNEWSEGIPGIGGHMLIVKESQGLHANDEGYKMAITDALSVAMKMLGFGADVYAGLWDGSKYKESINGDRLPKDKPAHQTEHWCYQHNCAFKEIKRGDNRWYSHKIEGTDKWCNEKATESPRPEPKKPDDADPFKEIYELARKKGITLKNSLLDALGVKSLSEVTPEYAKQVLEQLPDALQEGMQL